MTTEDVLKFCDKGNHEYDEVDILKSIMERGVTEVKPYYMLFQCNKCPSKWVKQIKY